MMQEKYNEVEFENTFRLLKILKNTKFMVTRRWPPNFVSSLQKLLEIFDRLWNDYFWDLELGSMGFLKQIYIIFLTSYSKIT